MAGSFVGWLDERDGGGLQKAADAFGVIASTSKGLEFTLARAGRGQALADLSGPGCRTLEQRITAFGVKVEAG